MKLISFWYPQRVTVCKILVALRGNRGVEVLCEMSKNAPGKHAEEIALEIIVNKLHFLIPNYYNSRDECTELEIYIKLNYSSCGSCQRFISEKISEIQELVPNGLVCLHVLFSILFGGGLQMDEALNRYAQWMLALVEFGIIVVVYPIFICEMVPGPYDMCFFHVWKAIERDKRCIANFRKLLTILESGSHSFQICPSHKFFNQNRFADYDYFNWNFPPNISIFPGKTLEFGPNWCLEDL